MNDLLNYWFWQRHKELQKEARQTRLARELRRERKSGEREPRTGAPGKHTPKQRQVREGVREDAPRISELLELNEVPR